MKNFLKISNILFVVVIAMCLQSCITGTIINAHRNRKARKATIKIEKALDERDFQKAREILLTINDDRNTLFAFCDDVPKEMTRDFQQNKINEAQLTYLIMEGEYEIAQSVCKDYDCQKAFQNIFAKNIEFLSQKQQYDFIFKVLLYWQFQKRFIEKGDEYANDSRWGSGEYNQEIQAYNQLIHSILQNCILNNDVQNARRCLLFYKPEAEIKKKLGNNKYLFSKTKQTAKQEAIAMMQEAGMDPNKQ